MRVTKIIFMASIILSIVLVGKATGAQANPEPIGLTRVESFAQVAAQANPVAFTGLHRSNRETSPCRRWRRFGDGLGGSFVTFDPSVGGTPAIQSGLHTPSVSAQNHLPTIGICIQLMA